ncbi:MAG: hybrid sensor histidine kinase/response regulator [Limisphaerales bacterium]
MTSDTLTRRLDRWVVVLMAGWTLSVALSVGWGWKQSRADSLASHAGEAGLVGTNPTKVPLTPYRAAMSAPAIPFGLVHGLFWLLGMAGVAGGWWQVRRSLVEQAVLQAQARRRFDSHRLVLDQAPIPYQALDADGRIVEVNDAMLELSGVSRDESVGTPFDKWLPADAVASFQACWDRIRTEGRVSEVELTLRVRSGAAIQVAVEGRAECDRGGRFLRAHLVFHNITSRKQVEESLRQSEERHRTLLEASPTSIVVVQDGRCVYVNPASARHMGCADPAELIGLVAMDGVAPEYRAEVAKRHARAALGLANGPMELELIRRDGSRAISESTSVPIVFNGRPALLVMGRDITEQRQAEAARRTSEERLQTLVENLPGAVYRREINAPWRVDYASDGFLSVTGYPATEFSEGRITFGDIILPDDQEQVKQAVAEAVAARQPYEIEYRARDAQGGSRWLHEKGQAVGNGQGAPAWIEGVIFDVTRRKAAEQRLAREEVELAAMYEHAPVMMLLMEPSRHVRRVNRAVVEFVGRPGEEIVGHLAGDLLCCLHALGTLQPCGQGPACPACKLRLAVTDTAANAMTHRRILTRQSMVRGSQMQEYVLLVSTAPVDVDGRRMVLVCLEDVTAQKQTEERAAEQAALLDVAHDAISVRDLTGAIQYWNKGAERLYGWSAEEVAGRNAVELLLPRPTPRWLIEASQVLQEGGEWKGEHRALARGSGELSVFSRWTLLRDPQGKPRAVLVVDTDVTEKKRLEAQFLRAQRLESIGVLAGGVAHDLNNILAPILMAVPALRETVTDDGSLEILAAVENCALRGAGVVRQILTFARGVDGVRGPLQMRHLFRETLQVLKATFPKSIQIETDAATAPWTVRGDATQIQQVMTNLCVNARDAMPKGGVLRLGLNNVRLQVALENAFPNVVPGPYVVLSVADTGTGIAPEVVDRMFDPFFTTKTAGQGTGLGLATVLGIVKSHGGGIVVETIPGQGTRFDVYLPSTAVVEKPVAGPKAAGDLSGHGELVLLVDDEPQLRHVIHRTLVRHGYEVVTAANGAEALNLASENRNRLAAVLSDYSMPVMDGVALVRTLRSDNARLPLILMSGLGEQMTRENATALGASRLLVKPFKIEELLQMLRDVL